MNDRKRYAFTELLRGVDVCLILDQFGELITCPIQEGDGALFSNNHFPEGELRFAKLAPSSRPDTDSTRLNDAN
jgi:hypothetical protein